MNKIFVCLVGILIICEIIASPVPNPEPQPTFFAAVQNRLRNERLDAENVERANVEARNAVERANVEARNSAARDVARRIAAENELARRTSSTTTTLRPGRK